ncbi:ExeM/NucH family extracellular endonuclease [Parvularcula dongshanensis]|uniref:VCBS repeat-containing protein n=1 Tax=Parvularcula dongshanensis TaxID=1173995 RepID=A0A840I640_9PROT|nr:VCBS repeat-containing protein [Parvularcula dongshanensis]
MVFKLPRLPFGTNGDDTLYGTDRSDLILGRGGNDTIYAGAGRDLIQAGAGNDTVYLGAGGDVVLGGKGFDTVVLEGGVLGYEIDRLGRSDIYLVTDKGEGRGDRHTFTDVEAITFAQDGYTYYLDGRNNDPFVQGEAAATGEDDALSLSEDALLANDVDLDGDAIGIAGVDAVSAAGASVSFENGVVTYDPAGVFDALAEGETATDTFSYTVSDGRGGSSVATVTVTVTGTNDAPVLSVPSQVAADEGETSVFTATATDAEGDAITFSLGGDDADRFVIDAATGEVSFAEAPDFESPADADGDNAYELIVTATDANGASSSEAISVAVDDVLESTARINEFHYDNAGGDVGEFVEVRTAAGADVSGLVLELVNGNDGGVYAALTAAGASVTSDGAYDYYVFALPTNGLQNGSPDGLALSDGGQLVEFLSYEGSFEATEGAAAGVTSTDIGVFEPGDTSVGFSLQRNEDGSWDAPRDATAGYDNDFIPLEARINELHYDNAGTDVGEFVEVRTKAGADASGLLVELLNGSNGTVYDALTADEASVTTDGEFDYYVFELPTNGLQNGSPDGLALSVDGTLVEFLSYEGEFAAAEGAASGQTSIDIGVEETSNTEVGQSLQRGVDDSWAGPASETRGAANELPVATSARINELHYDNDGADVGEFVEVRVNAGEDVSGLTVELVNGNGGSVYGTTAVAGLTMTSDGAYDYYVWELPSNGIQNGSPDGLALSIDGQLIEFLSYEGIFTASAGAAAGETSVDIGVSEAADTAEGLSLQREDDGSWTGPREATAGADNAGAPPEPPRLNEVHYDNAGTDTGEFVEVRVGAGADVSGLTVELLNGNGGVVYESTGVAGLSMTSDGTYDYYVWDVSGIQNGPDGLVLAEAGTALEFFSYEGTFQATEGAAAGLTSTDMGVAETSSTPEGQSLYRTEDGGWAGPEDATPGAANDAGAPPPPPPGELVLISTIQGNGYESMLVGQAVTISAVVTRVVDDGFYVQEEVADYDGDEATSEGIFIANTDGAVDAGNLITVSGTVEERFGLTSLTNVTSIDVTGTGIMLPEYVGVTLPLASEGSLERFEGMRVSLTSSTDAPITVIENFNFDRYGEVVVGAGTQVQPTQVFDAQTQADEIDALQEANALNRLIIDDGVSSQNPSEFGYAPATAPGDNGNGYIDAGDDFGLEGPTLRLGAEMSGPVEGVLGYGFSEYRLLPDGTLPIDEATNTGAREATPSDVGGSLQVVSMNTLNYFTSLSDASADNPAGQARGATSAEDFARQTDKLVNAVLASGGEVFGFEEVENNGFGEGSAIRTLVEALNAAVGEDRYAFVIPDGAGADGRIGTDAITNAIVYDQTAVTLDASEVFTFDDGGSQQNRPAVAASFVEIASGESFALVVNHLKSKGGSGSGGDADIGDGQGAFNETRTDAAQQLADWIATDPLGTGDGDYVIVGDFNAYAQEDPIQLLRSEGLVDLIDSFIGQENAYSYTFDGQRGTLDHGFATGSLADQVTGVTEWHINADEPDLLGYSSEFTDAGFYGDTPFSASDHDPLIIGLELGESAAVEIA